MSPVDEYRMALGAAALALHWAALPWEKASPGVARHLRRLADRLSAKAEKLRLEELDLMWQENGGDDPLDTPADAPTERTTLPYGIEPTDKDPKK